MTLPPETRLHIRPRKFDLNGLLPFYIWVYFLYDVLRLFENPLVASFAFFTDKADKVPTQHLFVRVAEMLLNSLPQCVDASSYLLRIVL